MVHAQARRAVIAQHAAHEAALEIVAHGRLDHALYRDAGGRIDGVYVCTAVSDDDPRRKPNTGMFADLLRDHPEVEAEKTIMIGDSASDRVFARDSGISFFII